ncbi:MAG: hypothetical protein ABIH76_09050 [Candidatus Bathyarchaeota archaeon]
MTEYWANWKVLTRNAPKALATGDTKTVQRYVNLVANLCKRLKEYDDEERNAISNWCRNDGALESCIQLEICDKHEWTYVSNKERARTGMVYCTKCKFEAHRDNVNLIDPEIYMECKDKLPKPI